MFVWGKQTKKQQQKSQQHQQTNWKTNYRVPVTLTMLWGAKYVSLKHSKHLISKARQSLRRPPAISEQDTCVLLTVLARSPLPHLPTPHLQTRRSGEHLPSISPCQGVTGKVHREDEKHDWWQQSLAELLPLAWGAEICFGDAGL